MDDVPKRRKLVEVRKEGHGNESGNIKQKQLEKQWGVIPMTKLAHDTVNPIRNIVDKIAIPKSTTKQLIPLSIGDPTIFGNLSPPSNLQDAVIHAVKVSKFNGYAPSTGLPVAREAIAQRYGCPEAPLKASDVIIASGCSGALTLAIQGLANAGDNILVPRPGFSLYATIAGHTGIEIRHYDLLPDQAWECDLDMMASLIDSNTKGIVINNPSNPTGSNYSRSHLEAILAVAEEHKLPIIADEIYGYMVFKGETFIPLATLTTTVPIISCSGIAKQYVVPGWRLGWITIHDRNGVLKQVAEGIIQLSQLILGANTIAQACIEPLLRLTPPSFFTNLMNTLERQAMVLYDGLLDVPGLTPIKPQGAMYIMVKIDVSKFQDIINDEDFSQKLLNEELVFVLPGACFQAPNFVRLVFCAPDHILQDSVERMTRFCLSHKK